MLYVPTFVGASSIHGLGLFAEERIASGSLIWKYDARLDSFKKLSGYSSLPPHAQRFVSHFCTVWDGEGGQIGLDAPLEPYYLVFGDNARYINHSVPANTENAIKGGFAVTVAKETILPGEEITENYRQWATGPYLAWLEALDEARSNFEEVVRKVPSAEEYINDIIQKGKVG